MRDRFEKMMKDDSFQEGHDFGDVFRRNSANGKEEID